MFLNIELTEYTGKKIEIDVVFEQRTYFQFTVALVQRCRPGGSMHACDAAGPGSIPSEVFPGFSSPVRQIDGPK